VTDLELVRLGPHRVLEVLRGGAARGPVVLAHHGTPTTATFWADWSDTLAAAGLRLVAYSRPGYGASTRVEGRVVADAATDSVALLDALGIGPVVSLGYSGGGPHALAVGALAADRCRGVVVVAGVGPCRDPQQFVAGMGEENVAEMGAALAGRAELEQWMSREGEPMLGATGEQIAAALGDLLDETDRAVLADGWADGLAAEFHRVAEAGTAGWVDDDLALTRPWGFEPDQVTVPVTIWHAGRDRMAPVAHSRALAAELPDVTYHEVPDLGHLALLRHRRGYVVECARTLAR
jgi:pimeloyl-ACP methyl ester carboxylesterase